MRRMDRFIILSIQDRQGLSDWHHLISGDQIDVSRGIERYHCVIKGLNNKRRPAKEAQLLYVEFEESRQKPEEEQAMHKMQMPILFDLIENRIKNNDDGLFNLRDIRKR